MCDELAENGVIAIAPDFLNGQKFEDADGASKAVSAVTQDQVKAVLDATADYALKIPACNGTLTACGFCRGGGWAFAYANENPKLKAVYSFYGTAPDEASKIANIACPVYGFYGENDERVNATIPKAEELMKAAGKKVRARDLQRCRTRFHALRRTNQSRRSRRRQDSARRGLGALEEAAETA